MLGQFIAPAHQRLKALAQNLWWSWDEEAVSLFRDLDPVKWRELDHNPIAMLQQMSADKLEERASQLALHSRINYTYRRLQEYLNSTKTWGLRHAGVLWARPVAYFSAEFGIHESVPIYSGGLGVLSGDHIKSASDLGIPLIGIGLFYSQGYFKQRLNIDGWQQEDYLNTDHRGLADEAGHRARWPAGARCGSTPAPVRFRPGCGSWRSGATRCICLDSDVEGNQPEDRELTARLYGGDQRVRIRQELVARRRRRRALQALGDRARRVSISTKGTARLPRWS